MPDMLYWLPGAALLAGALLLLPTISPTNMLVRRGMILLVLLLSIRYFWWRITQTIPSIDKPLDMTFGLIFLGLELMLAFSTFMCLLTFWRHRDNRPQAERNEAESHTRADMPAVDVFIPTYNESWEVLERSILGAKALDYPHFKVWVLDDTRRDWLREKCAEIGVRYLSRPDNKGAKAGNLNHALNISKQETGAPFIMVLDADFVPKRNFLRRTVGFFTDQRVALVQTPQFFFNPNMLQHNFMLSESWVDEQRFFFDTLQPAKDGWDVSYCCGTSFIARRAAIEAVGGYPTETITEDILLSFKLIDAGYISRYLNEKLSTGLAPETINEYIKQRSRWGIGAIQSLFVQVGPFGRNNLKPVQRLLFLETANYWLSLPTFCLFSLIAPLLYWYGGIAILHAELAAYSYHFIPAFFASTALFVWVSSGRIVPILTDLTEFICASRVAPAVWSALLFRKVQPFRVTGKGLLSTSVEVNWPVFTEAATLFVFTAVAVVGFHTHLVDGYLPDGGDPTLYVFWSCWNLLILALLLLLAIERPRMRREERFLINEDVRLSWDGQSITTHMADMSVSGARLNMAPEQAMQLRDRAVILETSGCPPIQAQVTDAGGRHVHLRFDAPEQHASIVTKLYTGPYDSVARRANIVTALRGVLRNAFGID
ncbi:cellulose synthase catalytic subunit [Ferrovibrio sp.]|uniref:glycosyltransferase family 2 protein n=1 Tax=Ferrovibrio sp. TaxID=1917215 RepID=UPI0025BF0AC1|nr:cellulose synthase catalytic subunit [Ferrovibrio sp.]MBX3453422.1 glycosyltransferase [Ferrovibrio sp.]